MLLPKLKKDEFEEDLLLSPRAALEEVVEIEEGVDGADEPEAGEGTWRRDILGNCNPVFAIAVTGLG